MVGRPVVAWNFFFCFYLLTISGNLTLEKRNIYITLTSNSSLCVLSFDRVYEIQNSVFLMFYV